MSSTINLVFFSDKPAKITISISEKDDGYFAGEVGESSAEEDASVEEEVVPSAEFSHASGDTVTTIYDINDSCKQCKQNFAFSNSFLVRGTQVWQVSPVVG